MVNAWSLAASVLDGTLDEDYPIMNTKKSHSYYDKDGGLHMRQDEIKIDTSDEQVMNVPLGDVNLDENITISTNEYGQEHSPYYYDYNRNDPDAKNPFTDAFDYAMGEAVVSGDDYPSAFTTLADNDDQIAHHFADRLTLNIEDPIQEIMSDSRNKYHEKLFELLF